MENNQVMQKGLLITLHEPVVGLLKQKVLKNSLMLL